MHRAAVAKAHTSRTLLGLQRMPPVLFRGKKHRKPKSAADMRTSTCARVRKKRESGHAPTFYAEASSFRRRPPFFPHVYISGRDGAPLLCVEPADGHWEHIAVDGVEDLVGVACGPYARVGESRPETRRGEHVRAREEAEGRRSEHQR